MTVNYNEIEVFEPQKVEISNPSIYEGYYVAQKEPNLIKQDLYRIHRGSLGIGNKPLFLFTNPEQKINSGTNFLVLNSLKSSDIELFFTREGSANPKESVIPNDEVCLRIAEELGFREEINGKENKWLFLKQKNDGSDATIFWKMGDFISPETLAYIIENFDIKQVYSDFFSENYNKDSNILYAFVPKLINFGNEPNPENMRYQDHTLLITNTKTGKTYIGLKFGKRYGSGSGSRLLGYSTADRSFEGELNGQYEAIFCDEINEEGYSSLFFDYIPSIMENGTEAIAKGSRTLFVKCSSDFTFLSNLDRKVETSQELLCEFSSFLTKFTGSPQRIGSRMALTLFGDDFEEAEKVRSELKPQDIITNKFIVLALSQRLNIVAKEIIKDDDVANWLENPIKDFKEDIQKFLEETQPLQEVKDYWNGVTSAYRHIRGMALKHSIIDNFLRDPKGFIDGKYNIREIIESGERHTQIICDLNIQNLRKMMIVEKSLSDYLLRRFDGIRTEYVKVLVALVSRWVIENQAEVDKNYKIPLIQIGSYFDKLDEKFKIGRYSAYSRLEQKIPEHLDRLNREARIFGFEVFKVENDLLIGFLNKGQDIQKLSNALHTSLGNTGNSGKEGKNKEEITSLTHNTRFTQSEKEGIYEKEE